MFVILYARNLSRKYSVHKNHCVFICCIQTCLNFGLIYSTAWTYSSLFFSFIKYLRKKKKHLISYCYRQTYQWYVYTIWRIAGQKKKKPKRKTLPYVCCVIVLMCYARNFVYSNNIMLNSGHFLLQNILFFFFSTTMTKFNNVWRYYFSALRRYI